MSRRSVYLAAKYRGTVPAGSDAASRRNRISAYLRDVAETVERHKAAQIDASGKVECEIVDACGRTSTPC